MPAPATATSLLVLGTFLSLAQAVALTVVAPSGALPPQVGYPGIDLNSFLQSWTQHGQGGHENMEDIPSRKVIEKTVYNITYYVDSHCSKSMSAGFSLEVSKTNSCYNLKTGKANSIWLSYKLSCTLNARKIKIHLFRDADCKGRIVAKKISPWDFFKSGKCNHRQQMHSPLRPVDYPKCKKDILMDDEKNATNFSKVSVSEEDQLNGNESINQSGNQTTVMNTETGKAIELEKANGNVEKENALETVRSETQELIVKLKAEHEQEMLKLKTEMHKVVVIKDTVVLEKHNLEIELSIMKNKETTCQQEVATCKLEVDKRAKWEAKMNVNTEAERNATAEAKRSARAEAEVMKAKVDAAIRAKVDAEIRAMAMAEAETKAKAEAEMNAEAFKAEVELRAKAEAEMKERARAEAEAKVRARAETEAGGRADAEAKAMAEAEAKARAKAEAEVKSKAEAEAKIEAEVMAKIKAEVQARMKAAIETGAYVENRGEVEDGNKTDTEAQSEAKTNPEKENGGQTRNSTLETGAIIQKTDETKPVEEDNPEAQPEAKAKPKEERSQQTTKAATETKALVETKFESAAGEKTDAVAHSKAKTRPEDKRSRQTRPQAKKQQKIIENAYVVTHFGDENCSTNKITGEDPYFYKSMSVLDCFNFLMDGNKTWSFKLTCMNSTGLVAQHIHQTPNCKGDAERTAHLESALFEGNCTNKKRIYAPLPPFKCSEDNTTNNDHIVSENSGNYNIIGTNNMSRITGTGNISDINRTRTISNVISYYSDKVCSSEFVKGHDDLVKTDVHGCYNIETNGYLNGSSIKIMCLDSAVYVIQYLYEDKNCQGESPKQRTMKLDSFLGACQHQQHVEPPLSLYEFSGCEAAVKKQAAELTNSTLCSGPLCGTADEPSPNHTVSALVGHCDCAFSIDQGACKHRRDDGTFCFKYCCKNPAAIAKRKENWFSR